MSQFRQGSVAYDWQRERDTITEINATRDVPPEQFPGHKAIFLANLEGWLGVRFVALLAERDRYRQALIDCATISGADVSGGIPGWPDVDVWAVEEVQQLRTDHDEDPS